MTRFMMNYLGKFGEYWREDALKEVKQMWETFYLSEIELEDDGAAKWVSNGHYLPEDCAEMLKLALTAPEDPAISVEATNAKRSAQNAEFIRQYRENRKKAPVEALEEEAYEMQAAFGKGTTVVNVFTGERITL